MGVLIVYHTLQKGEYEYCLCNKRPHDVNCPEPNFVAFHANTEQIAVNTANIDVELEAERFRRLASQKELIVLCMLTLATNLISVIIDEKGAEFWTKIGVWSALLVIPIIYFVIKDYLMKHSNMGYLRVKKDGYEIVRNLRGEIYLVPFYKQCLIRFNDEMGNLYYYNKKLICKNEVIRRKY